MKFRSQLTLVSLIMFGWLLMAAQPSQAATATTTPIAPWRYSTTTANYRDKSTSAYYQDVWRQATKNWQKKGFKWKAVKGNSKTVLTSYSDNSAQGVVYIGMKQTKYTASGRIISNKVMVNRASFKRFNYNKAERVKVAEHELGHALGLAHNNPGSVSVMNPANRSHSIKNVDVKGLNLRYRTPYKTVSKDTVYVTNSALKVSPDLAIQGVFGGHDDCEHDEALSL